MEKLKKPIELIVTDIDNTVFDWITYYVHAFETLIKTVSDIVGVSEDILMQESSVVFEAERSTEYPFLIQELPSVNKHFGNNVEALLRDCVEPGRKAFLKEAAPFLKTYAGVIETLTALKQQKPELPIAALTDAPRYVAMWKLNKLGILNFFDAVYGLGDPRIPVNEVSKQIKVDQEILVKHLQRSNFGFSGKVRTLPDEYEKPGVRGFKTILMDFGFEELGTRERVLWIGDHPVKDIGLGHAMGVTTCFASYGNSVAEDVKNRLVRFSSPTNARRNAYLEKSAADTKEAEVHRLDTFADLLKLV